MRRHESHFRIHLFDLDAFGEVPAPTWLRFFWQTATDASSAAGFAPSWYQQQGTIWVIRRTILECLAPVVCGEGVAICSWVSDIRRVRSQREYEVRRLQDRQLVVRGGTDWVYIDTRRGQPVSAPDELQRGLMPGGVVAQPRPTDRPGKPPESAFRTSRRVEFTAIDTLAHVNNAHYVTFIEQDLWDALAANGWGIDPMAREGRLRLRRHDLQYFDAAVYGDQLTGTVWVTRVDAEGFTSEHALHRDGHRLLHARSMWCWSGGRMPDAALRAAEALMG